MNVHNGLSMEDLMSGSTMRSLAGLACAAAITLCLTGCGSSQKLSGGPGPLNTGNQEHGTTAAEETPDGSEPGTDDLAKDVDIVKCVAERPLGVSAVVEVTNSFDEPWEYIGTLDFRDPTGKTVASGTFNTGTLEPGESSTEEVPGINFYGSVPSVTCELVEARLDEPGIDGPYRSPGPGAGRSGS
jgi:hypothetical protein